MMSVMCASVLIWLCWPELWLLGGFIDDYFDGDETPKLKPPSRCPYCHSWHL